MDLSKFSLLKRGNLLILIYIYIYIKSPVSFKLDGTSVRETRRSSISKSPDFSFAVRFCLKSLSVESSAGRKWGRPSNRGIVSPDYRVGLAAGNDFRG